MGFDFLIIGGGIIGLSIARELKRRGAGSVAVIDRGRIGSEASWAAAGMLAPNAETHEDGPFFRFCTASNALYPGFAAQLLDETGVDVELDPAGTMFLSFGEGDGQLISEKYHWQKAAGIEVESLSSNELLGLEPQISPLVRTGLFYPNDWQVENRRLVHALGRSCGLQGVRLIEGVDVIELLAQEGTVSGVRTLGGQIQASVVIVAAGAWASRFLGRSVVKPIRGQMISLKGGERLFRSVIYSESGYLVPRADGRVLAGATVEDVGFSKEVLPEAIAELRGRALEISPALANFDVKEAWAGLRPYSTDGLPIIGPVPGRENMFVATGHFRNGILLAPITGELVADALLNGTTNEYLEAFSPDRLVSTFAVSNRV